MLVGHMPPDLQITKLLVLFN